MSLSEGLRSRNEALPVPIVGSQLVVGNRKCFIAAAQDARSYKGPP